MITDKEFVELPGEFIIGLTNYFPELYKAHYNCYDEVKQELIGKFSKYLKDDFSWEDRIVELMGTIWG